MVFLLKHLSTESLMGTYKSIPQIRRLGKLRGTETIINANFEAWIYVLYEKDLPIFIFLYISTDAIERRKIVAKSFFSLKEVWPQLHSKNVIDFLLRTFLAWRALKIVNFGAIFFHALNLFYMGEGENNIPLDLSLITQETNKNMYTSLYLFCWFSKNSWNSGIGFPTHTHFKMTSSNTRNKLLWIN